MIPKKMSRISILISAIILNIAGCTKNHSGATADLSQSSAQSKVINLAIWSNYVSPELLEEFEKKSGIKVQISNYSSNE